MNWNILIAFGIGIGAYLVGLAVFCTIKAIINKNKLKKELKEHGEKTSNQDSNAQV